MRAKLQRFGLRWGLKRRLLRPMPHGALKWYPLRVWSSLLLDYPSKLRVAVAGEKQGRIAREWEVFIAPLDVDIEHAPLRA